MVTELAILRVDQGRSLEFEAAFASVVSLLAGADGYVQHCLAPTLDEAGLYLLQVEWRDLEAHIQGFEPSPAHERFISALAPFLAEEPVVLHMPTDTLSTDARSRGPRTMNG